MILEDLAPNPSWANEILLRILNLEQRDPKKEVISLMSVFLRESWALFTAALILPLSELWLFNSAWFHNGTWDKSKLVQVILIEKSSGDGQASDVIYHFRRWLSIRLYLLIPEWIDHKE